MKFCPRCKSTFEDSEAFCPNCGLPLEIAAAPAGEQAYASQQPYTAPVYADPADHTREFAAEDISKNKIVAMLPYLMGWIGIIVAALIGGNDSPYVQFHIRQSLKIQVVMILAMLVGLVGAILVLPVIAAGIFALVLEVVNLICFFSVCSGNAKEAPIVKGFSFLK